MGVRGRHRSKKQPFRVKGGDWGGGAADWGRGGGGQGWGLGEDLGQKQPFRVNGGDWGGGGRGGD